MNDRCRDTKERIAAILVGDASPSERDAVEAHVLECPDCRQYQESLLRDDQLLTSFVESVEAKVSRLEGQIMETIETAQRTTRDARTEKGGWPGAWLFGSRWMKAAAAVVVVLGTILAVNLFDRPGDSNTVWARVIKQVEDAEDFICRIRQDKNVDADLDMVQYRSAEYGYRVDIYRRDSGQLAAAQYLEHGKKTMYVIVHRDKTYARVELSDEQLAEMKKLGSAKELVGMLKSGAFEDLGERTIDGTRARGIEVKNPAPWRPVFEESEIRVWIDRDTEWPVKIEWEGIAQGGEARIKTVMDRFQWNPSLTAEDFEFEIPSDYTMIGQVEAVRKDEAGAIEGLREYAAFSGGRYPSTLTLATALHEIDDTIAKRRRQGDLAEDDLGRLMKIQNACALYADLIEAESDPAYYGNEVGPKDFDQVLLRWRIDDGRYRVIYGDLRSEDVSAVRLEELERR